MRLSAMDMGFCADVEPTLLMEKYLFAVDELTGLIGAAALMRPTGMQGMEVKSVMKKIQRQKNSPPAAPVKSLPRR